MRFMNFSTIADDHFMLAGAVTRLLNEAEDHAHNLHTRVVAVTQTVTPLGDGKIYVGLMVEVA